MSGMEARPSATPTTITVSRQAIWQRKQRRLQREMSDRNWTIEKHTGLVTQRLLPKTHSQKRKGRPFSNFSITEVARATSSRGTGTGAGMRIGAGTGTGSGTGTDIGKETAVGMGTGAGTAWGTGSATAAGTGVVTGTGMGTGVEVTGGAGVVAGTGMMVGAKTTGARVDGLVAVGSANYGVSRMVQEAIEKWPRGVGIQSRGSSMGRELRQMILDAAISDIKKLLDSKVRYPKGQDFKRHMQVLELLRIQKQHPERSRTESAEHIANAHGGSKKLSIFILPRERDWVRCRYICPGLQGKTGKVQSMLEDEGTLLAVREYITTIQQKGNGLHLTAKDLANFVVLYWKEIAETDPDQDTVKNLEALESVKQTIEALQHLDENPQKWTLTSRTAVNWLHRLGYDYKEVKKGLFKDGHERVDVVEYRQSKFLPMLKDLEERLVRWNSDKSYYLGYSPNEIRIRTGQPPCVLVTHDECIFYANDGPTHEWTPRDSMPLCSKGHGRGIMLSMFITSIGRLKVPESVLDDSLHQLQLKREASEWLEFGGDRWWNNDRLLIQTMDSAVPLIEYLYPGCQGVFLFDNAPNHKNFPDDALRANLMNLTSGGKAPIMRDGWFRDSNGHIIRHPTNFPFNNSIPVHKQGKPKGLKLILAERGLWNNGLRLKCEKAADCDSQKPTGCCACTLMSLQEDFQNQKTRLQEAVEARGHIAILYPTFHCELNWIEYFWGAAKWFTRKHSKYGIQDLREQIPKALEYAEKFIFSFWKRSQKIAQAYRDGVGWGADKKYKSHRRVPEYSRYNGGM